MMALAVFLDGELSLAHGFHHQDIANYRHDRSRCGRSHAQQTHFIRMSGGQTDIGLFRQWAVRITSDDDIFQIRVQVNFSPKTQSSSPPIRKHIILSGRQLLTTPQSVCSTVSFSSTWILKRTAFLNRVGTVSSRLIITIILPVHSLHILQVIMTKIFSQAKASE